MPPRSTAGSGISKMACQRRSDHSTNRLVSQSVIRATKGKTPYDSLSPACIHYNNGSKSRVSTYPNRPYYTVYERRDRPTSIATEPVQPCLNVLVPRATRLFPLEADIAACSCKALRSLGSPYRHGAQSDIVAQAYTITLFLLLGNGYFSCTSDVELH